MIDEKLSNSDVITIQYYYSNHHRAGFYAFPKNIILHIDPEYRQKWNIYSYMAYNDFILIDKSGNI